jgi:hypothetical protein
LAQYSCWLAARQPGRKQQDQRGARQGILAASASNFSSTARERKVLNGHFRVKVSVGVSNKTAAG